MGSRWDSLKPSRSGSSGSSNSRGGRYGYGPSSRESWRKKKNDESLLEEGIVRLQCCHDRDDMNDDWKGTLIESMLCYSKHATTKTATSIHWKALVWMFRVFQKYEANPNTTNSDDDNDSKIELERQLIDCFQLALKNKTSKRDSGEDDMIQECTSRIIQQIQSCKHTDRRWIWLSSLQLCLHPQQASSESIVKQFVHSLLTPTISTTYTQDQHVLLCDCINVLLQSSSSAMIAPLITDVHDNSGDEVILCNPNLQVTLSFLQHRVLQHQPQQHSITYLQPILTCLTNLFSTMKKYHPASASTINHISIDALFQHIQQLILFLQQQPNTNFEQTIILLFKLIHSMMDCFPQTMAKHWQFFLPTNSHHHMLNFITYTNYINRINISYIAIQVITNSIQILPFKLWLSSSTSSLRRSKPSNTNAVYQISLENRVSLAMQHLIQTITIQLQQSLSSYSHTCTEQQKTIINYIHHICQLISAIITKIPYYDHTCNNKQHTPTTTAPANNHDLLVDSVIRLFQIVVDLFLQQINNTEMDGTNYYLNSEILISLSHVIAGSMGGDETPQGTITSTPLPIQKWLQRTNTTTKQSNSLLDTLFSYLSSSTKTKSNHENSFSFQSSKHNGIVIMNGDNNIIMNDNTSTLLLNILHRIIRSAMHIVFHDSSTTSQARMDSFFEILIQLLDPPPPKNDNHCCNYDHESSLMGLKLFHAFICQKSKLITSSFKITTQVEKQNNIIFSKLPTFLFHHHKHDKNLKLQTLSIYGSLSGSDWEYLLGLHSNNNNDNTSSDSGSSNNNNNNNNNYNYNHFLNILQLCQCDVTSYNNKNNNMITVQSEACKTIGNIYSSCIGFIDNQEFICQMIQDGVRVLLEIVDPLCSQTSRQPTVKSMAIFALGNIALALKQNTNVRIHQSFPVDSLCRFMQNSLDDKNEKIVGNAIRTTGHLFYLLNQNWSVYNTNNNESERVEFMERIVENLNCKIETALSDVTTNNQKQKRSWKQRSNTKKHAWGSCRCLSFILTAKTAVSITTIRRSLKALMNCVRYCDKLNEKIPSAAISTLNAISIEIWSEQSWGDNSSIGECISVCLVLLYKVSKGHLKINHLLWQDTNILMKKLLGLSNETDIHVCLFKTDLSHEIVEFLYGWMVKQRIESRSFELVSTPLQYENIPNMFTVSLAQKFRSRAAEIQRKENSNTYVTPDDVGKSVDLYPTQVKNEADDDDDEDEL